MKKGILFLLIIISFTGFVLGATCGNGKCEAGQLLDGGTIEDTTTCYQDCFFRDYEKCKVDSIEGGTCSLQGKTYEITNLNWTGCGGMGGSSMGFTISSGEHSINFDGLIPQTYVGVMDNLYLLAEIWPCAVYTTQKTFYLMTSVNSTERNNFLEINKNIFNLKEDSNLEVRYVFPIKVSNPYCKSELKNADSLQIITSIDSLGCSPNPWEISLENFSPGKYILSSQYLDENAENKIGDTSIQILINGCQINSECNDKNIFTRDECAGTEIKECVNKINILLISMIILGIILIGIALFLITKKTKKKK